MKASPPPLSPIQTKVCWIRCLRLLPRKTDALPTGYSFELLSHSCNRRPPVTNPLHLLLCLHYNCNPISLCSGIFLVVYAHLGFPTDYMSVRLSRLSSQDTEVYRSGYHTPRDQTLLQADKCRTIAFL